MSNQTLDTGTAPGRLVVVSNRLPVSARMEGTRLSFELSTGGLATGLHSWHARSQHLWIGWPGVVSPLSGDRRAQLDAALRERGIAPVHLSAQETERYYEGFSNRVLWPLFHYQIDRVPVDASGWDAYETVNRKFADAVAHEHQSGDAIWVHDYQLMLLPALLRDRLPEARIGFFLHIPFPSSEVFRVLPWRRQILHGLLGADLVGFHTFAYLRHFVTSLLHVDGIESEVDRVQLADRTVKLGVFPMSIDAQAFQSLAKTSAVIAEAEAIRNEAAGRRIVLGVDRLDYTKGIPRRLQAFERLLSRDPSLRDRVRYIQVAVPSRGKVDTYQSFRKQVEEAVGRINGGSATLRSTPIHYLHQAVSREQLVALYRAADVMLVTPLRDGMNLVAKEFLASRVDDDGVLVLSEFAGAAAELGEALIVNPYDVEAVSSAITQALAMTPSERRTRMKSLRRRVLEYDVHRWSDRFVSELKAWRPTRTVVTSLATVASLQPSLKNFRQAARRAVLLDYDGTLVPLAQSPELATPDPELLSLLAALAADNATDVHLISGRAKETVEEWFGILPLTLWAEHGFWYRPAPIREWEAATTIPGDWLEKVYPILEQFTASTPGSMIERKRASVAWHYRIADPEFGPRQAHELRMLLGDALSNQPLEVLEGKKVIEVRLGGISKALVVHRLLTDGTDPAVLAIGDDRTDEDLFAALPDTALTLAVGVGPSRARHRLKDHRMVREILQFLIP